MNRIDLIVDRLENCKGLTQIDRAHLKKALAAARELRALQPVAWASPSIWGELEGLSFDKQPRFDTPLYALEVTK